MIGELEIPYFGRHADSGVQHRLFTRLFFDGNQISCDRAHQHHRFNAQRKAFLIVAEPDQHSPFLLVKVSEGVRFHTEGVAGSYRSLNALALLNIDQHFMGFGAVIHGNFDLLSDMHWHPTQIIERRDNILHTCWNSILSLLDRMTGLAEVFFVQNGYLASTIKDNLSLLMPATLVDGLENFLRAEGSRIKNRMVSIVDIEEQ